MRNKLLILGLVALCAGAFHAVADEHEHKSDAATKETTKKEAPQSQTITGEIVDTGCFLAHGARGEKHASCAAKCINGGTPMGLLTDTGALYLLTPNHDNADAYTKLKGMAAKTVTVTGTVMDRSGMKGIDVTAYKAMAANAEPTKADGKKADAKQADSK